MTKSKKTFYIIKLSLLEKFQQIWLITDRPARSAAMPLLFLLRGPKMGYVAPINVKFGTGQQTELRGYTPLGKIYTKKYQFWRFRRL